MITFEWMGYKTSLSAKKRHIWGILKEDIGQFYCHMYTFHCECNSAKVHIERFDNDSNVDLAARRFKKLNNGYREITKKEVELRWPEVIKDIEMQFVVKKLQNV